MSDLCKKGSRAEYWYISLNIENIIFMNTHFKFFFFFFFFFSKPANYYSTLQKRQPLPFPNKLFLLPACLISSTPLLLLLSRFSYVRLCATPHRRQPTRPHRPWNSPGKNTGVSCHFLLQCMKVKSESEVAQSCPTQRPHGLQPTRLLHPWDFPGKSTGVGCHCLLCPFSTHSF